jgi:hypothetical protein
MMTFSFEKVSYAPNTLVLSCLYEPSILDLIIKRHMRYEGWWNELNTK